MKDRVANIAAVVFVITVLALIGGWVTNIIKIMIWATSDGAVTAMFVLRVIGIFVAPLGAVLGFM